MVTRLDFSAVDAKAASFPKGDWRSIAGAALCGEGGASRTWKDLDHVRERGGNYGFLLPHHLFIDQRTIVLDGPARSRIPFHFFAKDFEAHEELFVVYVGKASNLHQRFQWHFSAAVRNTGAQVQYGLVKSGVVPDRAAAIELMLQHALIVYSEMHGPENTANRDLLELKLCARFGPPFNIKSER